MSTIGYATLQIIPSMRNASGIVEQSMSGLGAIGTRVGGQIGQGIAGGIAAKQAAVDKASEKVAKSREKEMDAAGKVRVAEAQLQELRDRGITSGARFTAATERLATATRRSVSATDAARSASRDLDAAQTRLAESTDEAETETDSFSDSLSGVGEGARGAIGDLGKMAIAAAGVSSAMEVASSAMDFESATAAMNAGLGATGALAEEYGQVAGSLWSAGMGDSMEDVTAAVKAATTSFQTLGFEGEASLETVATRAMNFGKVFEVDVTEAMQSASQLVTNGLAADSTAAFDMMTTAFQRVPAAMQGELPEILNEYGTHFRALGFDGQTSFNVLIAAAQKGKFALDKTGDALKEFTIRGSDMSTASTDAFKAVGLDAEEMARKIAAGGPGAQSALQETAKGLLAIKDPAERANNAIALFGTPLEDLSVDQIPEFLSSLTGSENAMAGFEGATDRMGDTLNDTAQAKLTAFTRGLQQGVVDALGKAIGFMSEFGGWLSRNRTLLTGIAIPLGALTLGLVAANVQMKIAAAGGFLNFIRSLSVATRASAVAQVLFNTALWTSPITWLVAGIAALVGGLIWFFTKTETGKRIWETVWNAIKTSVSAVWDWISGTLWPGLMGFFQKVGDIAMWLWTNAIQPAWNGIKGAIALVWDWLSTTVFPLMQAAFRVIGDVVMWLWNSVIQPAWAGIQIAIGIAWNIIKGYFALWQFAFKLAGAVVMWLWNNAIAPAWNGIKAAIGAVWSWLSSTVFPPLQAAFRMVGDVAMWLWTNAIQPAWEGIKSGISAAWDGVIKPAMDGLMNVLQFVGDKAMWLWQTVMVPAWDAIKGAISAVWDFIKPILDNIGKGIQALGDIASKVGDAMRNAFDGVVDVLKAPIHAVGKLLASLPGSIMGVDIPGISTIKSWGESMQSLRTGGVVGSSAGRTRDGVLWGPGTGTSDSILGMDVRGVPTALVSNREGIVTEDAMDGGGAGIVAALNRGWRPSKAALAALGLPAYATGGVVGGGYGLPAGTNTGGYGSSGSVFPDWVHQLESKYGVKASTYPGHQESDRNEAGYAPNPNGLNRGIDWSGPLEKMQAFAEWLLSIAPTVPALEQIIWQNPNTQAKIGWHGRTQDDGSYFASDYPGHQDHVHTRQSAEIGAAPAAAPAAPVAGGALEPWPGGGGEGNLKPIAVMVRRMIHKWWPSIGTIGGYRASDPYPDHPSGQALDIMTSDVKVGTEVNDWLHQNKSPLSLNYTIWQQKYAKAGQNPGELMGDRGSPTQNHMDHIHALFGEIGSPPAADPNKIPDGLQLPAGAAPLKSETTTATPTYNSPDTTGTPTGEKPEKKRMKSFKELGQDAGGILAEGIGETFGLPSWIMDPASAVSGDDGSNVRTTDSGKTTTTPTTTAPTGTAPTTTAPTPPVAPARPTGSDGYSFDITKTAKDMGLPKGAAIIGNAASLVEVGDPLKNYANSNVPESLKFPHDAVGTDFDSIGILQQRGNGAWGTVADRMNPPTAAKMFFEALKKVPGWESMDPGAAAQAVQRSAFPDRYAAKVGRATELVDKAALFDTGGLWKPGQLGFNGLNEPEMVLRQSHWDSVDDQTDAVRDLVRAGGGGTTNNITVNGLTAGDIVSELGRYQWRGAGGYGSRSR
ncbi:phage tail tape measure protein [Gordonia malaquae]|uniref:phage tail tape measure protein n=1 Tax=Gordonia malaquae TaxID=410332 RepID=UPI0030184E78